MIQARKERGKDPPPLSVCEPSVNGRPILVRIPFRPENRAGHRSMRREGPKHVRSQGAFPGRQDPFARGSASGAAAAVPRLSDPTRERPVREAPKTPKYRSHLAHSLRRRAWPVATWATPPGPMTPGGRRGPTLRSDARGDEARHGRKGGAPAAEGAG